MNLLIYILYLSISDISVSLSEHATLVCRNHVFDVDVGVFSTVSLKYF